MKKVCFGVLLLFGISMNCAADSASITISNHYALVAGHVTLPSTPPLYNVLIPNLTFTPILTIYQPPDQPGVGGLPPGWAAGHPGYGIIINTRGNVITFPLPEVTSPVLPLALPAGFSLACCQSNVPATFEMIVGRPPDPGTMLYRLLTNGVPNPPVGDALTNYMICAFTNGSWTPQVPVTGAGEAVWIYQPPMISTPHVSGTNFTFGALTGVGSFTAVEYTDSLTGSWQVLTNIGGDGSVINILDSADVSATPQRFYRLNMRDNNTN